MDRATVATLTAVEPLGATGEASGAAAEVVRVGDELGDRAVRGFEVRELDWQQLAFAESDLLRLKALVHNRFGLPPEPVDPAAPQAVENRSGVTFDAWAAQAKELAARIEGAWVPIFSGRAKLRHAQGFADEIAAIEDRLGQLRLSLLRQGYGWYVQAALARVQARVATGAEAWRVACAGVRDRPARDGSGAGSLWLAVGSATLTPPVITTVRPGATADGPAGLDRHVLPMPECGLPLLLDLDRDGGLVTDSVDTVAALVIRAAELLPAGRLTVSAFDPGGLGDSARLLRRIGAAGPGEAPSLGGPVLAGPVVEAVRTTDGELAELLQAVEDTAEPPARRFLVLFGGPELFGAPRLFGGGTMFGGGTVFGGQALVGGGLADAAEKAETAGLVARLARIIERGRAAGVSTFLIGPPSTVDTQAGADRLPALFDGQPIGPATMARLIGAVPAGTGVDFPLARETSITADTQLAYVRDGKDPFALRAAALGWRFTPPAG